SRPQPWNIHSFLDRPGRESRVGSTTREGSASACARLSVAGAACLVFVRARRPTRCHADPWEEGPARASGSRLEPGTGQIVFHLGRARIVRDVAAAAPSILGGLILLSQGRFVQNESADPALAEGSRDRAFLEGGGKVGALMRTHDWSNSPLGAPETWPQSLRAIVALLLHSKFPMFVAWGKDLGFLYNDPYAEILGAKHPRSLGARFYDIWSEIWPDISPLIGGALAGEANYREDLPLVMNRKGYDEQTWFTFSYSPVRDESGRIAGMFCACTETTERKLTEDALRQSRAQIESELKDTKLLQGLSAALIGEAETATLYEKVMDAAAGTMRSDFASMQMLYPERGEGGELRLLTFRGFSPEAAEFWEWVGMDSAGSTCGAALRTGRRVIAPDVET